MLYLHPPRPPIRSARAAEVARWFDLSCSQVSRTMPQPDPREVSAPPVLPGSGQILLITGPSGSGKTLLLNHLRASSTAAGAGIIDMNRPRLPPRPLVDCFGKRPLAETVRVLAQVGLGEAWTYLHTPAELSEGQRWRLRLAMALARSGSARRPRLLIADEFAALLDRVSARIVARVLRREVDRRPHLSAMVATGHDDLKTALLPDLHLTCDFGVFSRAEAMPPASSTPAP